MFIVYFADLELHVAVCGVEEATEGLRGPGHILYDGSSRE